MIDILRSARLAARRPQGSGLGAWLLPSLTATFLGALGITGWFLVEDAPALAIASPNFSICRTPPHQNCVMDGDTFYLAGEAIRIADIDAPETHPARCPWEAEVGAQATRRLRDILNARPFELRMYEREQDKYGRKLRVIAQDGTSVGSMLVMEGLARRWTGKRMAWCS